MAFGFIKKTWKDRISEYPTRRTLTKEDGSTELVTVSRSEGTVSQEGDAYCADNMNDLEKRVDDALNEANSNLTAKYNAENDTIQVLFNGEWVDCFKAGVQTIDLLTMPIENWTNKSYVTVSKGVSTLKFTATASSNDNTVVNATYSEKLYASSGKKLRVIGISNLGTTYANLIGISEDGVNWTNVVNGGTYTPTQFSAEIPLDNYKNGFYLRINTKTVNGRVVYAEFTKFEIS